MFFVQRLLVYVTSEKTQLCICSYIYLYMYLLPNLGTNSFKIVVNRYSPSYNPSSIKEKREDITNSTNVLVRSKDVFIVLKDF